MADTKLTQISKIKPNPNNPRLIKDDKFAKLVQSIKDFPDMLDIRPIVCNKDMIVLGGNMRLKACIEAGLKKVPVIIADLTEEQQREFIIKDNVSGGEWDWNMIANEWDAVQLTDWGLDIPDFAVNELEATEDDYEIPDVIETDIVLGDLFEIGEHRLLCGDSTDTGCFTKLMGEKKPDIVFADPPYGVSIVNTNSKKVGGGGETKFGKVGGGNYVDAKQYAEIIGDDTTETAKEFYYACISMGYENFVIWGGNYFTDFLPPSMCWIVWDKENTGNFADCELAWTSYKKAAKLYKWLWNGMSRKGSKEIEGKTRVHPTQKPVGLFNDIFKDFEFNTAFDGFGGSGSTMVACEQVGKKCYMIEMSPEYCQVIIDRMRKLDPTIKIKRNGEEYGV